VTLSMTPEYAPPEVFDGAEPGPEGDVYSLGATIYALLAGRPPYSPDRPLQGPALIAYLIRARERQPIAGVSGVPNPLMEVLRRSMEPDLQARIRTAAELRDALARVRPR
jgi:serine/threonine protein kinase